MRAGQSATVNSSSVGIIVARPLPLASRSLCVDFSHVPPAVIGFGPSTYQHPLSVETEKKKIKKMVGDVVSARVIGSIPVCNHSRLFPGSRFTDWRLTRRCGPPWFESGRSQESPGCPFSIVERLLRSGRIRLRPLRAPSGSPSGARSLPLFLRKRRDITHATQARPPSVASTAARQVQSPLLIHQITGSIAVQWLSHITVSTDLRSLRSRRVRFRFLLRPP